MKVVLNEVENTMYSMISLNLDSNSNFYQHMHKCIIAKMLQYVWVGCGDCSQFWEINKLSVMYEQCGDFILKF